MARPGAPGALRRAAPAVGSALALTALAVFLFQNRGYIQASWSLRPGAMAAIAALAGVSLYARGLSNQRLFVRLGVAAPAWDWFRIVTASALSNYLPLSAGLFAKAIFLKRLHAMPYRSFAAAQVALLVLVVTTHGAVALATLLAATPARGAEPLFAVFALMVCSAAVLFLPEPVARRVGGRFFDWEASTAKHVRSAWPAVAGIQALILLISAASLRIAFGMGRSDVSLAACVLFSAAAVVTRFVSVTPGALGIRELLIGGLAHLTGFSLRDAVIAATLVRSMEMAVVFSLGSAFAYGLSGRLVAPPAGDERE